MLFPETTPKEKRQRFRAGLASGTLQRVAGAQSPLVALAVADAGFDGVYIGSSTLSSELGFPDIGLITLPEAAGRGQQIARVSSLPTIIDIDTGFGEAVNAGRTIREMEDAGIAAFHIEDQMNPKRCGHLDNKALVDVGTMVQKIRAAAAARRDPDFTIIARTDARAVEGFDAAVARGRAYVEAGADMVFPEAMQDANEFAAFRREITVPLLANMTEFGKSPLLSADELQEIGYNVVIYPATAQRLAMKAVEDGLKSILQNGGQGNLLGQMQTRSRLYELIRYDEYAKFDQNVAGYGVE